MIIPKPRGPLSEALHHYLSDESIRGDADLVRFGTGLIDDVDETDAQIALWTLYELHYQGFEDVDGDVEWDPALIGIRALLETQFEHELRRRASSADLGGEEPIDVRLNRLIDEFEGPSLARFIQREATREHAVESMMLRSVYQLKEADPHTWLIPRLEGAAKSALVELQFDEYGAGYPERMHSHLFAVALAECGLDASYGAYVNELGLEALELNNAFSLLCLRRRLRGAAAGHLAAFEATSSIPSRQYAQGFRRLGLSETAIAYFDEHVEADAVHEQLAIRGICSHIAEHDASLSDDIMFGAYTCLDLDRRFAAALLTSWGARSD